MRPPARLYVVLLAGFEPRKEHLYARDHLEAARYCVRFLEERVVFAALAEQGGDFRFSAGAWRRNGVALESAFDLRQVRGEASR